ncbi:MAG: OadG family protein [Bacteroidales bacterium]|nr:OadG family protein [Bacteroidales bacterium]
MRRILASIALLVVGVSLSAQNASDLVLAEVLVENDSSIVDDYGRRTGWIELFNNSQGTVNYAGCFLSDGKVRYMIPKGDARTKLGPRQSVVFFCSGNSEDGTFYTNFTLQTGTTLMLISNNGKTIIDTLSIPESLPVGFSVRKTAQDKKGMVWKTEAEPAVPTPGVINKNGNEKTGAERMAERDPHGWILTLTSISVVFSALIILWIIFGISGRAFQRRAAKAAQPVSEPIKPTAIPDEAKESETAAAIALALHLYLSETVHDAESFVITVNSSGAENHWPSPGRNFRKEKL